MFHFDKLSVPFLICVNNKKVKLIKYCLSFTAFVTTDRIDNQVGNLAFENRYAGTKDKIVVLKITALRFSHQASLCSHWENKLKTIGCI